MDHVFSPKYVLTSPSPRLLLICLVSSLDNRFRFTDFEVSVDEEYTLMTFLAGCDNEYWYSRRVEDSFFFNHDLLDNYPASGAWIPR
jgi:hypothetical protein